MSDDKRDDRRDLGLLASRFIRAGAEAVAQTGEKIRERGEDLKPRDLVRGAAGLTARGKDEVMALMAREVRSYIEHLGLVEEIERFATTHSLDVSASFKLRPLDPAATAPRDDEADDVSGEDAPQDHPAGSPRDQEA